MTTGVVVMAYGTPAGPDDVEAFYTDIRRGRPPSVEQLAELMSRYAAIGGVSPLAEHTAAQVGALQAALEAIAPGHYVASYGAKHSSPKIEQAVESLVQGGATAIVGLVLAPHFSQMSVGEYVERAGATAARLGVPAAFVERWGDDPVLVELLVERTERAIAALELSPAARLEVVFTAHSLPVRILEHGDRYPDEIAETAALVAAGAGLSSFRTGWQSAGRTTEEWLGPDILDLLRTLAAQGTEAVVVCPCGFTSDHLEVCYDLDVEASALATTLGVKFARTESLNDEPRLARALAGHVVARDPHRPPSDAGA